MKRWTKYIKPYLPYFILGPLCMIIEVLGEVFMPRMMAKIMSTAVVDNVATGQVGKVILFAVFMVIMALLMMAGGVGGAYFGAKASVNFAADLRLDIYKKIQKFSFANIDKYNTGSLITRLTNDVTQLQNFVNMLLRMFLRSPGMLIGALIMAIRMKPTLATVLAVTIPLMLFFIIFIIRFGFPRFGTMQKKIDTLNATVQENLTNIRVVKSFVREDFEEEKFHDANENLKKAGISAMSVMIFMHPVTMLFMNLTTLAVIYFGGKMVMIGDMPVSDLAAFITYINQILMSLTMFTMMFMSSSRALASSKRITEVLDETIDLDDINAAFKDALVTKGSIEFKNVSFRYYKDSDEKVLDNINLVIKEGTTVGIIGSTGCGKTTLVSLIPRLYDTDEGEVFIDGINVKDYSLHNLREGVGMVLQKNVLFSGTIGDNLKWGNEDATDEDIINAAENSQAHSFITNMKDGYETELDQGGTNVSGGQKQRLCIARALLKKPKILILDDSTSAVDTETEAKIREAFRNELKDSTKIIIAQRIGSVKDADMIIVLNEGKITGVGTHNELLENNTEYQEIYYSPMDKKEEVK